MHIKEFDTVLLKDGRKAAIVEVLDDTHFLADVGDSPADWDTIDITVDDIEKKIHRLEGQEISHQSEQAGGIFILIFTQKEGEIILIEKIYTWIRQRCCRHKFRKHYIHTEWKYAHQCAKCGKER